MAIEEFFNGLKEKYPDLAEYVDGYKSMYEMMGAEQFMNVLNSTDSDTGEASQNEETGDTDGYMIDELPDPAHTKGLLQKVQSAAALVFKGCFMLSYYTAITHISNSSCTSIRKAHVAVNGCCFSRLELHEILNLVN